jgi:hypothetical protein
MKISSSTRSVSAVIRSVSPVLRIDVVGPDPRPVPLFRSSAGWARSSDGPLLLNPQAVLEVTPSRSGAPHSESLGLESASVAADRLRRAAQRVRTPWLACCLAGWLPPFGRARSESVLAPCAMLARPGSIELIDLPFSHSATLLTATWQGERSIQLNASDLHHTSPRHE